jgi:hypothetical protein
MADSRAAIFGGIVQFDQKIAQIAAFGQVQLRTVFVG